MNFHMQEAIEVLERTPLALETFLSGLSDGWLTSNEGDGTWNTSEVIGHLIEGEKNDWIPRLEIILMEGESRSFPEFDRFSHLEDMTERSIQERLDEFKSLRLKCIDQLKNLIQDDGDLERTGVHPAFGVVRARELIAAWAVHDLTHIVQIARVMAERYREDVGPWIEYLGVLNRER